MVLPKEETSHDRCSPFATTTSANEGTIGTYRGKARYKIPLSSAPTVVVFCIGKIQGGQDHAFLFRGGLAN
jgi:hypothetical protein